MENRGRTGDGDVDRLVACGCCSGINIGGGIAYTVYNRFGEGRNRICFASGSGRVGSNAKSEIHRRIIAA